MFLTWKTALLSRGCQDGIDKCVWWQWWGSRLGYFILFFLFHWAALSIDKFFYIRTWIWRWGLVIHPLSSFSFAVRIFNTVRLKAPWGEKKWSAASLDIFAGVLWVFHSPPWDIGTSDAAAPPSAPLVSIIPVSAQQRIRTPLCSVNGWAGWGERVKLPFLYPVSKALSYSFASDIWSASRVKLSAPWVSVSWPFENSLYIALSAPFQRLHTLLLLSTSCPHRTGALQPSSGQPLLALAWVNHTSNHSSLGAESLRACSARPARDPRAIWKHSSWVRFLLGWKKCAWPVC